MTNTREPIVVQPPKSRKGESRKKRFQRAENPQPMQLTDRDVTALAAIARHRFLSGRQLGRLVYQCSESRLRRRMRALYDHGLVERVALVSQPAKGVPPFVYVLSKSGAAACRELDIPTTGGGVNGKGLRFLRHNLLINDVYITLHEATEKCGYRIADWRDAQALKVTAGGGQGTAELVRHPSLAKPTPFLPDAYFTLQLPGGKSFAFFLELDLATHGLKVWKERAKLYRAYADPQAGLFQRRFGRGSFRLAIVTTSDYRGRSRRDNLLETIHEAIGPTELFLAATLDDVVPERVLGAVWKRPGKPRPISLTINPPAAVMVRPQQ